MESSTSQDLSFLKEASPIYVTSLTSNNITTNSSLGEIISVSDKNANTTNDSEKSTKLESGNDSKFLSGKSGGGVNNIKCTSTSSVAMSTTPIASVSKLNNVSLTGTSVPSAILKPLSVLESSTTLNINYDNNNSISSHNNNYLLINNSCNNNTNNYSGANCNLTTICQTISTPNVTVTLPANGIAQLTNQSSAIPYLASNSNSNIFGGHGQNKEVC